MAGAAGGPALLPPAGDCRSAAADDGRLAGAGQPGVEAPASGGDDDEQERPLSLVALYRAALLLRLEINGKLFFHARAYMLMSANVAVLHGDHTTRY